LSALTGEERIRVLCHIGTEPLPDDRYGRLPSIVEHLSPTWSHEEVILRYPNVEGKTFQFPPVKGHGLFVRECYRKLYDIVAKLPTTESIRILLTGTPGVGKSAFLIYFVIRYLYESRTTPDPIEPTGLQDDKQSEISSQVRDVLIFQPAESQNEYYAFAGPNIVRIGTYSDFQAFFLLPTTWYLVDWKPKSKPVSKPAATLFALSPNSIRDEDFLDFEKQLAMRLCMPVWTYNELEVCRHHIFPELSNESLNYIYDRVGGVPRSCLGAPAEALRLGLGEERALESGLQRLEDAFNEIKDPLNVLRAQGESLGIKVSGRLLHKAPDSETLYWDTRLRVWASAYVINRFVSMLDSHSASNMNRQVMEGLARNQKDGTLGIIFECYVRHLFFKGGGTRLRKRRLYGASDKGKGPEGLEWFNIPTNLEHKPFSGMADFIIPEENTGTIWTPGPNFPSVDIILTPNSLFQITISLNHPVKQEPLRKILQKLPEKENITLYFVVPEEHFEAFTFQNYHNEQGNVSQKVPESVGIIEQWVLGVPLKELLGEKDQGVKKRAANTQQPRTTKKRMKSNAGETYQSNAEEEGVSLQSRNNPTGRYNLRDKK
jgi:hypothetical protein